MFFPFLFSVFLSILCTRNKYKHHKHDKKWKYDKKKWKHDRDWDDDDDDDDDDWDNDWDDD